MSKPKPTRKSKINALAGALPIAADSPPPQEATPATGTLVPVDAKAGARVAAADSLAKLLEQEDQLPVVRSPTGQFVQGQSGNPAGREKGSKNYVTDMRLAMESALRAYMHQPERRAKIMKLIDRVLEVGLTGADKDAINAAKIMFDRVLPGAKQEDDIGGKVPAKVVIVIENATAKPVKAAVVVEGQFSEVQPVKESGQMTDDENAGSVGTVQLQVTGSPLIANSLSDTESDLGNKSQKGAQTGADQP